VNLYILPASGWEFASLLHPTIFGTCLDGINSVQNGVPTFRPMPIAADGAEPPTPVSNESGHPYLSYRTTQNLSKLFIPAEHFGQPEAPLRGYLGTAESPVSEPSKVLGPSYEALAQAVEGGTCQ